MYLAPIARLSLLKFGDIDPETPPSDAELAVCKHNFLINLGKSVIKEISWQLQST